MQFVQCTKASRPQKVLKNIIKNKSQTQTAARMEPVAFHTVERPEMATTGWKCTRAMQRARYSNAVSSCDRHTSLNSCKWSGAGVTED